jgi:hypothetical protein
MKEIRGDAKNIRALLGNAKYAIDYYQREYRWQTKHVTEPDGRLLYSWIAFNSLYSAWDEDAGFPAKDRETWQAFIGRILRFDQGELLCKQLVVLRPQVLALLENKFLDPRFWRDPQAARTHRDHHRQSIRPLLLQLAVGQRELAVVPKAFRTTAPTPGLAV